MALDFFSGFENMTSTELEQGMWTANVSASVWNLSTARTGSNSLLLAAASQSIYKSGLSNAATRIAGFGMYHRVLSAGGFVFFAFSDGTPLTAGNVQVGLQYNSDGSISAYSGRALGGFAGGTLLGTTAVNMFASATLWYYVEVVCTFDGSSGSVQIFINNVMVMNLTSKDTTSTANAYANAFGFSCTNNDGTNGVNYDDLYVLSGTGGERTARLGPCRVGTKLAVSGHGAETDFTPSTGSDRGAMVDDTNPNGDTDYNESTSVGSIDTYQCSALGLSGTVLGLQVKNYTKVDTGSANVTAVQRIGGVNYFDSVVAITVSYGYGPIVIDELSPATATNYTVTEIDAAEFGIAHDS
jgi:hypothetical protein